MDKQTVGILHPGEMGSSIAASMRDAGHIVYWASEGRSADSAKRAAESGLQDAGSTARLCELCDAVVSVCPPHAAEDVARYLGGPPVIRQAWNSDLAEVTVVIGSDRSRLRLDESVR